MFHRTWHNTVSNSCFTSREKAYDLGAMSKLGILLLSKDHRLSVTTEGQTALGFLGYSKLIPHYYVQRKDEECRMLIIYLCVLEREVGVEDADMGISVFHVSPTGF